MRKIIKIVKVLVIIMAIGIAGQLNTAVFAAETTSAGTTSSGTTGTTTTTTTTSTQQNTSINGIFKAGSDWISKGQQEQPKGTGVDDFVEQFIGLGQLLVGIGIVTILIVTVITAIRWITATPDKQAKLKEQLIGLVVATVVIFGAVGIWNLVRGIMGKVESQLAETQTNEIVIAAKK